MEAPLHANRGYVTLLTTLIVSVFGMALSYSLVYRAGLSASMTGVLERFFNARNYADACAETALLEVTESESYSGSGSLTFDAGSCDFSVVEAADVSTVESTGEAGEAVRKVRVVAQTNTVVGESGTTTEIVSADWSEVVDF